MLLCTIFYFGTVQNDLHWVANDFWTVLFPQVSNILYDTRLGCWAVAARAGQVMRQMPAASECAVWVSFCVWQVRVIEQISDLQHFRFMMGLLDCNPPWVWGTSVILPCSRPSLLLSCRVSLICTLIHFIWTELVEMRSAGIPSTITMLHLLPDHPWLRYRSRFASYLWETMCLCDFPGLPLLPENCPGAVEFRSQSRLILLSLSQELPGPLILSIKIPSPWFTAAPTSDFLWL